VRYTVKARQRKAARENKEAIAAEVSLPEGAPPPEHPGPRGAEHWSQKDEGHRERKTPSTKDSRKPTHRSQNVYRVSQGKSLLNSIFTMNPSSTQNALGSSDARMSGEFISLGEGLKLVPPFKGDKQEELPLIGNVDTAFAVVNPEQEDILYKFVLTRISGEPRRAISDRNLDSRADLKEFLKIHT